MAKARANGKRTMPKETATLDFGVDGYEGFHAEAWVDTPLGFIRRMQRWQRSKAKPAKEAVELFLHTFPSWDFVDYEGEPIPHTREGMTSIPNRLIELMWKRRAEVIVEQVMPDPLEEGSSDAPSGLGKASRPLKT